MECGGGRGTWLPRDSIESANVQNRLTRRTAAVRDLTSETRELYLSNFSQRTNEVMKVLTVMPSVFIPLTFVLGVYGMNFDNMPELG